MSCCSREISSTGRFFSRFARRYRRRYRRKGLEPTQRQLLAGLHAAGFSGASVLEIGAGVGYLHQTLLREGAAHAVGVDLSADMLREAEAFAAEQNLSTRVAYRQGDFVVLADELAAADVVVLDKVVCCYPDARSLIANSLAKTQRVYALTYPRDRAFNHIGVALMRAVMWIVRSPFRNYVHDPATIQNWITDAGFSKRYEQRSFVWLTQVFVR